MFSLYIVGKYKMFLVVICREIENLVQKRNKRRLLQPNSAAMEGQIVLDEWEKADLEKWLGV